MLDDVCSSRPDHAILRWRFICFARPSGRFASCGANHENLCYNRTVELQNPAWSLCSVDVDPIVLLRCRQARCKGRLQWPRGFLRCQPVHVCPASKSPGKLLACICYAVHASVYLPCRGPWASWYNTWLLIKLTPKGVVFCFFSSHAAVMNFGSLLWRASVAGHTGCMYLSRLIHMERA